MATSGVTNLTVTGNEIIKLALLDLGAIAIGEEPSTNEYTDARLRFNLLLKSLQTRLAFVNRVEEESFNTADGTVNYACVSGTDDVEDVWIERDNAIYPIDLYPDEARIDTGVTGMPDGVFIDKSVTPFVLYFYPVPDDIYEVHYRRATVLESLVSGTDEVSLPVKYIDMLVKGLALRLSSSYRTAPQERMVIAQEYEALLRDVVADNTYRSGQEIVAPAFVV